MGRAATVPARTSAPAPARSPAARPPAGRPRPGVRLPAGRPRPGHLRDPRRLQPPPLPRGAAVLDALLRGRAWIALVFVLLAGIVFFNVDLLRMNREIALTAERAAKVERENARLRTDLARLGSSERIQRVAAARGLVLPAPGEVRYLRSNPVVDARRAAKRIEAGDAGGAARSADPPQPAAAAPAAAGAPAVSAGGAAPAAPGVQPQE